MIVFAQYGKIFEHMAMSLYYVQKLLYQLNRDALVRQRFEDDFDDLVSEFDLSDAEIQAVKAPDLGYLYVIGVNGQILVHYSGFRGIDWCEYIEACRQGLNKYGSVREGIYAEVGYEGVESHMAAIFARRGAEET